MSSLEAQDSPNLVKKTLAVVLAMVGSCVVFLGVISLIGMLVVGKAVKPSSGGESPSAVGTEAPSSAGPAVPARRAPPAVNPSKEPPKPQT